MLRIENFNKLLALITNDVPAGRLLIEPNLNVFNATVQRSLTVSQGCCPGILAETEQFDVIIFNNLCEYIPNIISVLEGCKKHLRPKSVLVLNLPSSSGFFYQLAKILSKAGIGNFFARLWQQGSPSPYLHYFNALNLSYLLQKNGFEALAKGQLYTIKLKWLFIRISYTKEHSIAIRLLILFSVVLAFPLTKLMPSDIIYSVSRKKVEPLIK